MFLYPSKTKVECDLCKKELRKDRMKQHNKVFHPEVNEKDTQSESKSLMSFFKNKDKENTKLQNEKKEVEIGTEVSVMNTQTENVSEAQFEQQPSTSYLSGPSYSSTSLQSSKMAKSKLQNEKASQRNQSEIQELRNEMKELRETQVSGNFLKKPLEQCSSPSYGLNIEEEEIIGEQMLTQHEDLLSEISEYRTPAESIPKDSIQTPLVEPTTTVRRTEGLQNKLRSIFTSNKRRRISLNSSIFSASSSQRNTSTNTSKQVQSMKKSIDTLNTKLDSLNLASADDVKLINEQVSALNKKMDDLISYRGKDGKGEKDKALEIQALFEAKKCLLRTSKSVDEVVRYCNEFKCVKSENCIICVYCHTGNGIIGKFTYDFSLGEDFQDTNAPRQFSNLKNVLGKHIASDAHNERLNDKELTLKEKEIFQTRNYTVGMTLGRHVYKLLKTAGSYKHYETDVSVLDASGMDVGNINHSEKFASNFCDSVLEILMEETVKIVNSPLPATQKPPPVSLIADKLTPNRRTMQIVGFHGYVGQKFQSLVAGVPALIGEDGVDVTKTLKNGIKSLKIPSDELSTRVVGGAFDGEYFNLNVPGHFLDSELVSDNTKDWYSFIWDPAHIIELAEKDTRKAAPLIQKTFDIISKVSQSFSHGKSFRQLLDEAAASHDLYEEFNENEIEVSEVQSSNQVSETKINKVRTPGHFSDTRFATYSSEVMRKWLNNYEYYYRIMNRDQKDELDMIDNAPFLFSCGGLSDVYEVIGKTSNAVQKAAMTPWEVSSTVDTYLNTLQKMAENLKNESPLKEELFPTLSTIVKEVSQKGSYSNCPIFVKKYVLHSTRRASKSSDTNCNSFDDSINVCGKTLGSYVTDFVSNLRERRKIEEERNPILITAGNLFDVNKILNCSSPDDIKIDLEKYAELAKASGNLESSIPLSDLMSEYDTFASRVKNIAPKYLYKPEEEKRPKPKVHVEYPVRYNQLDLYKDMLETPTLYKDIGNILHLSLTASSRTSCEAVVEGMGSVMNRHIKERKTLNPKIVENETIIRWQGPHPVSKESTTLIKASLDKHFKGRSNWHFCSTDSRSKYFQSSEVLTRIKKKAEATNKIPFSSV